MHPRIPSSLSAAPATLIPAKQSSTEISTKAHSLQTSELLVIHGYKYVHGIGRT